MSRRIAECTPWWLLFYGAGSRSLVVTGTTFLRACSLLGATMYQERQQAARQAQEQMEHDAREIMELVRRTEDLRQRNNFGGESNKKS